MSKDEIKSYEYDVIDNKTKMGDERDKKKYSHKRLKQISNITSKKMKILTWQY
ncbi:MAG: hypothetical protein IJ672_01035 [Methanobrevibacter sp.]|nr:hypothetical protein [Methanobrevibacter sp.]